MLLILSTFSGLNLISDDVSAVSTVTWKQTSGNLASTAANWDTGIAPINTDNVILDTTSSANCYFDYPIIFGSLKIETGYNGCFYLNADSFITGLLSNSKTLTINTSITLTLNTYWGGSYSNIGTINGNGIFRLLFYANDINWQLGNIDSSLTFLGHGAGYTDRTFTLIRDLSVGKNLVVQGGAFKMIIDATGYYLGANGTTTILPLGIINYCTYNITSTPILFIEATKAYDYQIILNSTAISTPNIYTLTTNSRFLYWDENTQSIYGTPDISFINHSFFVNISISNGMLTTYQNYTITINETTNYDLIILTSIIIIGFLTIGIIITFSNIKKKE